jgi:hypothetical protein
MTDLLTQPPVRPVSAAVTTGAIMVALRERYCAPEFAFFEEVGDSGSSSRVMADGVAINMWYSRGYAITGFEVKASRSDWLRELKQPEKSEPILSKCDFWYLVAPDDVYQIDEVPITWGILSFKDGKLREKRKAPKLEPKPITRAFVAQMFRRGAAKEERDISARVAKELQADRDAYQKRVDDAVARKTRDLKEQADKWARVSREIGGHEWLDAGDVIDAVRAVQKAGVVGTYQGLDSIARNLRGALKQVEDGLKHFNDKAASEPARDPSQDGADGE